MYSLSAPPVLIVTQSNPWALPCKISPLQHLCNKNWGLCSSRAFHSRSAHFAHGPLYLETVFTAIEKWWASKHYTCVHETFPFQQRNVFHCECGRLRHTKEHYLNVIIKTEIWTFYFPAKCLKAITFFYSFRKISKHKKIYIFIINILSYQWYRS